MSDKELSTIEYKYLLEEIQMHSRRVDSITMLFLGGGIIPTMSFLLTNHLDKWYSSLLFTIPFMVLLPSIKLITSSLNSIVRISAYILNKYEKGSNEIYWQHTMQSIRGRKNHGFRSLMESIIYQYLLAALFVIAPGMYKLGTMIITKNGNRFQICITVFAWLIIPTIFGYFLYQLHQKWNKEYFESAANFIKENEGTIR